MLKYWKPDLSVTFAEFPTDVTLCVNISQCPGMCAECSEKYLQEDIGDYLTNEVIDELIKTHPGITVFGLMGGDNDQDDVVRVAEHIHKNYPGLKVGMYSGREYLSTKLLNCLDLYKIGRWIPPHGPIEEWHKSNWGPLPFPYSNQLLFEKMHNSDGEVWMNTTYKFRKEKINNPEKYIIRPEDNKD